MHPLFLDWSCTACCPAQEEALAASWLTVLLHVCWCVAVQRQRVHVVILYENFCKLFTQLRMCKYACTHAFKEPAEGIYLDMPFYATPIEYDGTPSLYYILLSVNQ